MKHNIKYCILHNSNALTSIKCNWTLLLWIIFRSYAIFNVVSRTFRFNFWDNCAKWMEIMFVYIELLNIIYLGKQKRYLIYTTSSLSNPSSPTITYKWEYSANKMAILLPNSTFSLPRRSHNSPRPHFLKKTSKGALNRFHCQCLRRYMNKDWCIRHHYFTTVQSPLLKWEQFGMKLNLAGGWHCSKGDSKWWHTRHLCRQFYAVSSHHHTIS